MNTPESPLLDLKEASAFLRLSPATLYDLVYKRKIPHRKHGRRLIFSRAELESWSLASAVPILEKPLFRLGRV